MYEERGFNWRNYKTRINKEMAKQMNKEFSNVFEESFQSDAYMRRRQEVHLSEKHDTDQIMLVEQIPKTQRSNPIEFKPIGKLFSSIAI